MRQHDTTLAYCPKCGTLTPHARIPQYDYLGALRAINDVCRCGASGLSHEEPLGDAPRPLVLYGIEAARMVYARWRVRSGLLHDEVLP